jgi:hypothetical protein
MITNFKLYENNKISEGTINDFKYDAVKKQIQLSLNNGSLTLDDISPNKYFIVCFGMFNNYLFSFNVIDKNKALRLIEYYKKDDNIWKIYVEKPTVDALVFLRKEWGWKKNIYENDNKF